MPRLKAERVGEGQKLSRVGKDVVASLKEALAHSRGEGTLPTREYVVPRPADVRPIRRRSRRSK